ncbi:DUF3576 domain-containing protein [Telmatospirillum siberiense]|uniref:DUF3576 domain-containing protein n=1 Tax=Telmatospirillum siberiense TaxID=382514 RepID=A0A2N3PN10_9PROT|nr:DUF3576 domain-containing protein [Telmatospirillum siberiense]PKU21798.1 DUF3576 domain-containing protein [Telmatospirillum siberiense]
MNRKMWTALVLAATTAALAACSQFDSVYPDKRPGDDSPTWGNQEKPGLFGEGGINLFGGAKKKNEEAGAGLGVNSYLWRASLDTLSFMPLASADPFGGVIITDWYAPPESPTERFKMSIFILDRTLRADGIHVSVFRQVQTTGGDWADSNVDQKTAIDVENAILTRAREMRSASAAAQKN